MVLRRGGREVRKAKAKADKRRDESGLRRFFIRGGQKRIGRFFGDFQGQEDPVVSQKHYVNRLDKLERYQQCNENCPEKTRCVYCEERDKGDKGISLQDRANFFLFDRSKYHKLEREVVDGGRKTKYPDCKGKKCPYCARENEPKRNGFSWWDLATTYGDQVVQLDLEAQTYCKCGSYCEDEDTGERTGTIVVDAYLCAHCEEPVAYDPDLGEPLAKCGSCRKKLPPTEQYSCPECEDAQRADLQDFWVRIERVGDDKDTRYNFSLIHPMKPPTEEELDAAEKAYPNWEEVLAGEPPELQAATLGVVFDGDGSEDHGSDEYGDDEDIDFGEGAPEQQKGGYRRVKPPAKPKIRLRAPKR